jgi:hypothetical protein
MDVFVAKLGGKGWAKDRRECPIKKEIYYCLNMKSLNFPLKFGKV